MTNERSAPENWLKKFSIFLARTRTKKIFVLKCLFLCIIKELTRKWVEFAPLSPPKISKNEKKFQKPLRRM